MEKHSRRTFFKRSLIRGTCLLSPSLLPDLFGRCAFAETPAVSKMQEKSAEYVSYSLLDDDVEIMIKGGESDFKIMHITDSHITIPSEEDKPIWDYCQRMHQAYKETDRHVSGRNVSREEAFLLLLERAKAEKVDLIVLSGDIVNFPSRASVDFVVKALRSTSIPFVYVSGNHDWHLEGKPGSDALLREQYLEVISPLYQGKDPLCHSTLFKGINFVCIDNSTYQVTSAQLAFLREALRKPYPVVLVMHIPLYTGLNNSSSTFGNPRWGRAIDTSYRIERREPWSEQGNTPETKAFYDLVMASGNLLVLAGHIHRNRVDTEKRLLQVVTGLSRNGVHRIIHFKSVP